ALVMCAAVAVIARPALAVTPAKTLAADQDPVADPAGVSGATPAAKKGDAPPAGSLTVPNPGTGLSTGATDSKGTFKPYAGEHPTNDENAQNIVRAHYSINMTWTLICGFLVMFMQAGFALVETGLIRGKNAGHTMSMNFMVYAIGMFGFFICGFAFMCGGANGTNIGGPGQLGGVPTLDSMIAVGSAVTYNGATDHGWGIIGNTGYFLTGK